MTHKTQNGWTVESMKAQIRLKNNGNRSFIEIDGTIQCMYRAPDGNCCAAGCFIPDNQYRDSFENNSLVRAGFVTFAPQFEHIEWPLDAVGMRALQQAHDRAAGLMDMRDCLCSWIDRNVEDA